MVYFYFGVFLLIVAGFVIFFMEPITYWLRKFSSDIANEPIRRLQAKKLDALREEFNPSTHGPTRDIDLDIERLISDNQLAAARKMTTERLESAMNHNNETLIRLYHRYTARLAPGVEETE